MKANVGGSDRVIRIIVGLTIIAAGFYYQSWWGLVGLMPLGSGLCGFCGFYPLLGISTSSKKADPVSDD